MEWNEPETRGVCHQSNSPVLIGAGAGAGAVVVVGGVDGVVFVVLEADCCICAIIFCIPAISSAVGGGRLLICSAIVLKSC